MRERENKRERERKGERGGERERAVIGDCSQFVES